MQSTTIHLQLGLLKPIIKAGADPVGGGGESQAWAPPINFQSYLYLGQADTVTFGQV